MKSIKRFSALLLSVLIALSLISVSAANADVKIIKEVTPETMDWSSDEVAYIDFSEIDAISLENGAEGHGIKLLPNNGASSWKAANRLSDDGYLLFGKEANTDGGNPEKLDFGNIYFNLDFSLSEKANTSYALKVDYFGGGIGVDAGSYIIFTYKNSSANEYSTPKYTYGSTYNSGKVESMYVLLSDANLSENVGPCKGDIRMNTYSRAQLKIRRISVVEYKPLETPALKEVRKGAQEQIASIDFSNRYDGVLEGPITGNGLSLLTGESTGNTRGSNILSGGYLLLGKEARQNDNPADMAAKPKVTGAVYLKLEKPVTEKQDTAYAVKIEYYGGGLGLDGGSYIDFCYTTKDGIQNKKERFKLGNTYNSGKTETGYWLIPEADFQENNGNCKADFRFETWSGAQIKIKSISVVPYDPNQENINTPLLFSEYSEGPISEKTALINANTGEYTGLSYRSDTQAVKIIDKNLNEHFAVIPTYDESNLGTFGVKISDETVKAAENAELTLTYWDIGTGAFHIEYDAVDKDPGEKDGVYTRTETVTLGNTGELVTHTFKLENTLFESRQTGGFDFKLLTYQPDFCIDKVVLTAVSDEPAIEAGDINGNHKLDSTDLAMLKQHLLGISQFENTDANSDGVTDIRDLINLKVRIASALN